MMLTNKKKLVTTAIAAVISAGVSMAAVAKTAPPPMEKCYGIAKAGKNDCGSAGGNACATQSKTNNDPSAWIFLPKGTCDKIVGGNTHPVKVSALSTGTILAQNSAQSGHVHTAGADAAAPGQIANSAAVQANVTEPGQDDATAAAQTTVSAANSAAVQVATPVESSVSTQVSGASPAANSDSNS